MKVKFISSLRAVVAVLCSGRLSDLLTLRRPALGGRKAAKPDFAEDQGRHFDKSLVSESLGQNARRTRTPSRSLGHTHASRVVIEITVGRSTAEYNLC